MASWLLYNALFLILETAVAPYPRANANANSQLNKWPSVNLAQDRRVDHQSLGNGGSTFLPLFGQLLTLG